MTINEIETLSSKRKFLKNIAYSSLLIACSSRTVSAAVRHVAQATHKDKPTSKVAGNHKNKQVAKLANNHKDKQAIKLVNNHKDKHLTKAAEIHKDLHPTRVAHNNMQLHEHIRQHDVIHTARHNDLFTHNHRVIHNDQEDVIVSSRDDSLRARPFEGIHRNYLSNIQNPSHKSLALQNMNTGEKIKLTYFEQGRYIQESLSEINHLFRDHHTDEVHRVDTALLDQLHDLQLSLGINKPYSVVCGYRSPATNGIMHFFSRGVAKHSLHMEGRATDIRIEGVNTHDIKMAALALGRGGVGYYPSNDFVHLDTGVVRTW